RPVRMNAVARTVLLRFELRGTAACGRPIPRPHTSQWLQLLIHFGINDPNQPRGHGYSRRPQVGHGAEEPRRRGRGRLPAPLTPAVPRVSRGGPCAHGPRRIPSPFVTT